MKREKIRNRRKENKKERRKKNENKKELLLTDFVAIK
jgi:hypothetical protein